MLSRRTHSCVRFRRLAAAAAALALAIGGAQAEPSEASFQEWVRGFWPQARAAGISADTYDRALAGVRLDPEVLERASRQAEFAKPVWAYLDQAVSEARITGGRRMHADLSGWLAAIERRFGVEREVVLAVWGMESSYGAILDNTRIMRPVIGALATLSYADEARAAFGRAQLLAALQILQSGDVAPERMTGSWAGAMGHTQFIPTTYLAHAVDFDGDGRRDIWGSVPDALASTANYLSVSGWRAGETWGYEIELPAGFDFGSVDEETARTLGEWERLGFRRTLGRAFPRRDDRASLLMPAGARGPAFLITRNFKAILRYNNATSYALAVGHLADRIAGGGPFARDWPRADKPLGPDERRELQMLLAGRGHDLGNPDGRIGPKTRAAIRSYQSQAGFVPDGYANLDFLSHLRGTR
jgi:membrane-bound lytic murein transglycosylase B